MKYIKALGYVAAANVMSLFIGLTLAMSSSSLICFISIICTVGILICLMVNFAINTARSDLKNERIENKKPNSAAPFLIGATASLPALISWIVLYISHSTGAFDYYKWHKLLNAYFLQIYNSINPDASTAALQSSQIMIMFGLVFIPFLSFITAYFLVKKGVIFNNKE